MLSEHLRGMAREFWQEAMPTLGPASTALNSAISAIDDEDKRALLALAYGTLPISDAVSVPVSVIAGCCDHALFLRRTSPFCRDISEDMFLHFVWYPRVNSEDLTDCRAFFYERLAPVVEGLGGEAAILAVNRWCAEHMTYQRADDRTESPMTAYRSGTGRCGEESVFLVTALRSVGVPARQVYAPWWAHCDDNHAWVEAWDGRRWRFLGACEPEPVLDRGWFCAAAARAPLVHYRTFFDCHEGDMLAERMGSVRLYAVTDRYAQTCPVTLQVLGLDGQPASGALVELDVVNMAAFRSILRGCCDEDGRFTAVVGQCDLLAEAFFDRLTASALVRPSADAPEIVLTLAEPADGTVEQDFAPPVPSARNRISITAAQREENAAILAACAAARIERAKQWRWPKYDSAEEPWPQLFALAAGNGPEIYRFYAAHEGSQRTLAAQMLQAMAAKDLQDVTFEILEVHFQAALPYAGTAHFVQEVLNPRIGFEVLENWRPVILAALTAQQRDAFRSHPEELMGYIRAVFPDPTGNIYPTLSMMPSAVLASGHADEKARRTLFVAVMRTLGVPARLDPADGSAQYWRNGRYHPADARDADAGTVVLTPSEGEEPIYGVEWSLARIENDRWRILDLTGAAEPCRLRLAPGRYRLTTAQRLPNGKQLCRVTAFAVRPGAEAALPLVLRSAPPEEMLTRVQLENNQLQDSGGNAVPTGTILPAGGIIAFLQPGAEPTEHILNELADAAPALRARMDKGMGLITVFQKAGDESSPAVQRVLAALPGTRVLFDEGGRAGGHLARKLFLEPGMLPLLAVLDSRYYGRFGSAGYQVGVVDLAVKLTDCME